MRRTLGSGARNLRGLMLSGALLALSPAAWPAFSATAGGDLVLTGARIYPAPDAWPIFDGTIVVAAGKIVAVGPREKVSVPAGARTIDCAGQVITAGFQNSHVHFTEVKWLDAGRQPAAKLTAQLQAMLTRYGFTTVVDTASFLPNTGALRRRIESGDVAGPRILTAGSGLYPPDGVPYYLREPVAGAAGAMPEEVWKSLPQPKTPPEAVEIVQRQIRGGADITKLFTGSWVERGRVLPMPVAIAAAAVDESHRQGRLVFSHPSNLAGLEVALDAKVDVLAHAVEDTRGMTPAHYARMHQQNMALIPTLKLFGDDRYLFDILDEVRDYARGGGQILFGTDVGYLSDYDPSREYVLMGTAGLSWREILAALTTSPAQRFGEGARRGRIVPGAAADLVVLAADPAADLRALTSVRYTVRAGEIVYAAPPGAP